MCAILPRITSANDLCISTFSHMTQENYEFDKNVQSDVTQWRDPLSRTDCPTSAISYAN